MPIYEYNCTNCHHQFDVLQKMNDEPTKRCPQCLEDTAVRMVSAAAFQLKGSGWYATDFKNKGKPENKTASPKKEAEKATSAEAASTVSAVPANDKKGE